jgi:hypothetical protein
LDNAKPDLLGSPMRLQPDAYSNDQDMNRPAFELFHELRQKVAVYERARLTNTESRL